MKKMWFLYAAVAALFFFVGNTLHLAGSFKSIEPHLAGELQTVYSNVPGPEDMDVDVETGLLFISSTDRWKTLRGKPSNDGIFLLRLNSATGPAKLPTTYAGSFHPHGISLLKADSLTYLFAVNHNDGGSYVEVFEFRHDTLFHQQSISDPSMCCPNDVVAVARNKFYVTNDHGSKKGFGRTLEEYLRLPHSKLLYFNGNSMTTAYEGMRYANGVNISADGSTLFVATTTGQNILTFDRDKETGVLSNVRKQDLHTGLDNIHVDREGNLWIASHPKLLAFVGHAKDSTKRSPSQVLKLVPTTEKGTYEVHEVLMDDGSTLSGSSIALPYGDQLFVGGVFERKVLRIKLGTPNRP